MRSGVGVGRGAAGSLPVSRGAVGLVPVGVRPSGGGRGDAVGELVPITGAVTQILVIVILVLLIVVLIKRI